MKCMIVVLATAMASVAVAQGPMSNKNPYEAIEPVVRAALNPKLAEKLGITEEQSAKLKALKVEMSGMKELSEKVRNGMVCQAALLKAKSVDEAAVMAVIDDIWAARKEIAKRQTKRIIAVKSILTPEQIEKIRNVVKTIDKGKKDRKAKNEVKGK